MFNNHRRLLLHGRECFAIGVVELSIQMLYYKCTQEYKFKYKYSRKYIHEWFLNGAATSLCYELQQQVVHVITSKLVSSALSPRNLNKYPKQRTKTAKQQNSSSSKTNHPTQRLKKIRDDLYYNNIIPFLYLHWRRKKR